MTEQCAFCKKPLPNERFILQQHEDGSLITKGTMSVPETGEGACSAECLGYLVTALYEG